MAVLLFAFANKQGGPRDLSRLRVALTEIAGSAFGLVMVAGQLAFSRSSNLRYHEPMTNQ